MTIAIEKLDSLLQPISEASPAGKDLREDRSFDSLYRQVKDARGTARTAERMMSQGEEVESPKDHWRQVLTLAPEILEQQSKDLDIAAWYTEALIRFEGLKGLSFGLNLMKGIIEQFWGQCYPVAEEDGLESVVVAITGLNGIGNDGTLIQPISEVMITAGSSVGPFMLWQCVQAAEVASLDGRRRQSRLESGAVNQADVDTAVLETDKQFFVDLQQDLVEAQQVFQALTKTLDEKCGKDAPPSSNIKNALLRFAETLKMLTKGQLIAEDSVDPESECSEEDSEVLINSSSDKLQIKQINDRNTALKQLLVIADYFRRAEPHSPLPYILERAVKWGNLPLPELLAELIENRDQRSHVFSLTGIEEKEGAK